MKGELMYKYKTKSQELHYTLIKNVFFFAGEKLMWNQYV